MAQERITVQIDVDIEYEDDNQASRDYVITKAKALHLNFCGASTVHGCYSAKTVKDSGREETL